MRENGVAVGCVSEETLELQPASVFGGGVKVTERRGREAKRARQTHTHDDRQTDKYEFVLITMTYIQPSLLHPSRERERERGIDRERERERAKEIGRV